MSFTAFPSCLAVTVASALLWLPPSFATAQPLTLAAAQRVALERSQLLRAQDSSVAASRDMAVAAGQLPDPVVKIGIDNLPIEGPDRFSITRDFMTMRRVGLMQEVTREEKRLLRSERFEREAQKTLAEKGVVAAQIERDTGLAWLERWYAEAAAREVDEQIRLAKLEIEVAEGLYPGGRGTPADLIAVRSMLGGLEDRAREAAGRVRVARNALARWVPEGAQTLGDPPDTDQLGIPLEALDAHLSAHPELQALEKQQAIADADVRLAQANRRADWTWEIAYQRRGSPYGDMISVGVSIPWQWDRKNRQDREVSARLALVDEARARRDEALRSHKAELLSMIAEWETARDRRSRYRGELLKLAGQRTEALMSAYRAGRTAALVDVIAAQRNEVDIRIQALQLELQIAKLWAQIRFIVPHAARAGSAALPGDPASGTTKGTP